ncbi:MAG: PHP domain-containing protein [Clostridia bacterium]|nr:PHP domain-containing protein [Clostridia bacterium]
MYKIETHLHVSEVSPCAKLSADEMIRLYAGAGYNAVFVSDHCSKKYFEQLGDMSWTEKTKRFFSGYDAAKAAGERYGIMVLPAAELAFEKSSNHYLVYGIKKEFMDSHPDFLDHGIEGFYPLARSCGMLVMQAHPYRDGACFPTPDFIDGVEVYNTNPRHEDHSSRTERLAQEHRMLISAGSDAHRIEDVGLSGVISEQPVTSADDFIALIRSGSVQIIREVTA